MTGAASSGLKLQCIAIATFSSLNFCAVFCVECASTCLTCNHVSGEQCQVDACSYKHVYNFDTGRCDGELLSASTNYRFCTNFNMQHSMIFQRANFLGAMNANIPGKSSVGVSQIHCLKTCHPILTIILSNLNWFSKRILFNTYCLCFYDIALWKHYSVTVFSKSCYHKYIKKLFGFSRSDCMSGILMQLSLPSFDTVIHNSSVLSESHCSLSGNCVTVHLCSFPIFSSF